MIIIIYVIYEIILDFCLNGYLILYYRPIGIVYTYLVCLYIYICVILFCGELLLFVE